MTDPIILSLIIGAGSRLVGGLLSRPKHVSARTNSRDALMGQAQGAREAAEKYGFNPLTLLGVSSAVGPSERSAYMGSAIADAGMIIADGIARRGAAATAQSALEQENAQLREQVQSLTLRPRVGGVYAQRDAFPSVAAAPDGSAVEPRRNPVIGDRPIDVIPATNSSGVFELENNLTGGPITLPGDGEPWGIDELLTAVIIGAPQASYNFLRQSVIRRDIARENARGNPVYRMEDGEYYALAPSPLRRPPAPLAMPARPVQSVPPASRSALPPFSYPPAPWEHPWGH